MCSSDLKVMTLSFQKLLAGKVPKLKGIYDPERVRHVCWGPMNREGDRAQATELSRLLHERNSVSVKWKSRRKCEVSEKAGVGLIKVKSSTFVNLIETLARFREKAVCHFEKALGIASAFGWRDELFLVHCYLAVVCSIG